MIDNYSPGKKIMSQSLEWMREFGDFYTKRNETTIDNLDDMYKSRYGIKRSELNNLFLKNVDKDSLVCEAGCNTGTQLELLQKMGFTNLHGVDINDNALKKLKQRIKNIKLYRADVLCLPFNDNSFDMVFTSGVLIHVHPDNLSKVLNELYRCTKRFIWGHEYFSKTCEHINYRNKQNMLWKNDFPKLFKTKFNLRKIRIKYLPYLQNDNIDVMYLLEKQLI